MSFLRFYNFSRSSYLLALILIFPLISCSGGDGGDGGSASGVSTAATVSWVAPSEREDNSGLSLSEIAGYRIYYGVESGNYQSHIDVSDGSAVQAQISEIPPGTYYVVLTTIDMDGRESVNSSEVIVTL